jgi:hypothetical protein
VKRAFEVALGILTAIGGFVEIGELVTGALVGARRLHGLVVGRSVAGSRLSRRRLHRKAVYVPWPAVTAVEDDGIVVPSPETGFASSTSRA